MPKPTLCSCGKPATIAYDIEFERASDNMKSLVSKYSCEACAVANKPKIERTPQGQNIQVVVRKLK